MAVVAADLIETAPAKVNLTLRVVGRRADGYHELESLVAFADIADTLTLRVGAPLALEIGGAHAGVCGISADNLVLKAAAALASRVDGLRLGAFILDKALPVAAGLGGGSADAAAALRLIARANALAVDDARVHASALSVGADVPVCLDSRARVMRGIGERLDAPLDLPRLDAVLVNPGVAITTKDVFAALDLSKARGSPLGGIPRRREALIAMLAAATNDLTEPAIACAPIVGEVLAALGATQGCRLARMSGSGATCFALYDSAGEAAAAARSLRHARAHWWIVPATLG
jgi:4-diphosphocytidyl-2-C-methyl-D-erythritol kinase